MTFPIPGKIRRHETPRAPRLAMKVAVLAAISALSTGACLAQSSVTMYGTVDLSGRIVKNDGSARRLSLSQDGINSSQLVFGGREDLGGGLWAGFNINAGLSPTNGAANATQFFNRRSTASLGGDFGEIRIGRDYVPTYYNDANFDAFAANGVGSILSTYQMINAGSVRQNNSVAYFLPSTLGGVYGEAMISASEGAVQNPGRFIGVRGGYRDGAYDVVLVATTQRFDLLPKQPSQNTYNIAGKYDFGVVKLLGSYQHDSLSYTGVDNTENRYSMDGIIPIGSGEVHVSYNRSKLDQIAGASNLLKKYAVGYVLNLSKRTALYTTYARLENGSHSSASVLTGTTTQPGQQTAVPTVGGKSTGFEVGMRHFF